jgi:hypothetical protein
MGKSMGNRQSIRRPRPNPLKLSAFVEFFVLVILVINFPTAVAEFREF